MLFLNNARVVINTIFAGIFDRFPKLKMVSVESGIGWLPFILETMDYELWENAPVQAAELSRMPSEYFKDHWYATFWFERAGIAEAIESVGADHLLFETDFPHPTCVYPDGLEYADAALDGMDDDDVAGIMGLNAARLYDIPLPN